MKQHPIIFGNLKTLLNYKKQALAPSFLNIPEYTAQQISQIPEVQLVASSVAIGPAKIENKPLVSFSLSVLPKTPSPEREKLRRKIISRLKENIKAREMQIHPVFQVSFVEE